MQYHRYAIGAQKKNPYHQNFLTYLLFDQIKGSFIRLVIFGFLIEVCELKDPAKQAHSRAQHIHLIVRLSLAQMQLCIRPRTSFHYTLHDSKTRKISERT